jgi:competence protein CoiA
MPPNKPLVHDGHLKGFRLAEAWSCGARSFPVGEERRSSYPERPQAAVQRQGVVRATKWTSRTMQLAIVDGIRVEAFSGGHGSCPVCGSETIAKCGPRIVHHWAHHRPQDCDPWWENETPWHRAWKNLFPIECREVLHTADDGEIHRADIKTPTGIVIEVQHSTMTDLERHSREKFYGNLAWVVDGSGFRDNFDIYHKLPDPTSDLAKDIRWFKACRHKHGANAGLFLRRSDDHTERSGDYHYFSEIESEVDQSYRGFHQYDWVRPRKTWLEANCPVYIDFGEELLVKLQTYDESGLRCVRYVSKQKFVHDALTETSAASIATRFYPLPSSGP